MFVGGLVFFNTFLKSNTQNRIRYKTERFRKSEKPEGENVSLTWPYSSAGYIEG